MEKSIVKQISDQFYWLMLHLSQIYQQLYSGEVQKTATDTFYFVSFLFHMVSVDHFFQSHCGSFLLVIEVQQNQQGFVLPPEQL